MAENFDSVAKIKQKRGTFMGGAREIKEIPKVVAKKEETVEEVVQHAEVVDEVKQEETPAEANTEDKLTVTKGMVVGYTDEGKILFRPFGEVNRLELVGLVEYSKAVSSDLLGELAQSNTSEIPALKQGMTAALQGLQQLLHEATKEAS